MSATQSGSPVLTGGCQCGAVRFATYVMPARTVLCHCRMCQKAVGGPFAVYTDVPLAQFAWTRGTPAVWRSSSRAERDFCARCGTPLSWRRIGHSGIDLLTGTFDRPDKLVPSHAVGLEGQASWLADLLRIPSKTTAESIGAEQEARIVNYQHPDRNMDASWTPDTTRERGKP
ncbi:MAG: GFA family protein [Hyphomicrobiaceae bacterium]